VEKPLSQDKYQETLARYYEEVKPLLAHMANLVLLYRHPVLEGSTDWHGTAHYHVSHHTWISADMEEVYQHLEETVRAIREDYFGHPCE
jgi:hypothetical protein